MLKTKEDRCALGISALMAVILLLLFSRCSPLYPTNSWGEANAFFTMGRGMLAGKLPYRDLALKAGPLLIALHALAACISSTGFISVWLLEIVAMTATLFLAWKISVRISGLRGISMLCVAWLALLLVSGRAFIQGDTAEEFALPFQMWALCDLLAYMNDERRRMSARRMMAHGFLAGCVFWLKYGLIGVHAAFLLVIAIDAAVRERDVKRALALCGEYLAGAVVSLLPWLIYFGMNGALDVFFEVYFHENWRSLLENAEPLRAALLALLSGAKNHPLAALALLVGAGDLVRRLAQRRWQAMHTAIVAAFVCTALIAYADGTRFRFSPLAVGTFLLLCAGSLARLAAALWRRRRVYGVLLACAALSGGAYAYCANENLPFIGYPESALPQTQFAQIMADEGGGTLLTCGFSDGGFYLAAGEIPDFVNFAESDAYFSVWDAAELLPDWQKQYSVMSYMRAQWVITRNGEPHYGNYELVAQASSPYDRSTKGEKGTRTYSLYKRVGTPQVYPGEKLDE